MSLRLFGLLPKRSWWRCRDTGLVKGISSVWRPHRHTHPLKTCGFNVDTRHVVFTLYDPESVQGQSVVVACSAPVVTQLIAAHMSRVEFPNKSYCINAEKTPQRRLQHEHLKALNTQLGIPTRRGRRLRGVS